MGNGKDTVHDVLDLFILKEGDDRPSTSGAGMGEESTAEWQEL